MTDAAWDALSATQQIAAWRQAIRKAVRALPPEDRTDLGAVVKFLLEA